MPVTHAWQKTVLRPARIIHPAVPEVRWWPHCGTCGAQVCTVGRALYYRAASDSEWSEAEPPCGSPVIRSTEREEGT